MAWRGRSAAVQRHSDPRLYRWPQLRDAASPVEAARQFKRSIAECGAKERICCPNKSRLASMKNAPRRGVLAGTAATGKNAGLHFVEMSVDETDDRLSRLDWSASSVWRW